MVNINNSLTKISISKYLEFPKDQCSAAKNPRDQYTMC